MTSFKNNQRETTVNKFSAAKRLKTGIIFVSLIVAGNFAVDTAVASDPVQLQQGQALQPGEKRQFGPGQNVPRGVRPQAPIAGQPGQAQAPAGEIIAREGKWIVQCDKPAPGADGKAKTARTCGMLQTVIHKTNKRLGLTLIFAKVKQGKQTATMMRILAPVGVYLPTGIALEVDGAAAGRVPFSRCDPRFCIAFAQVRKETLAKMRKGKKGKFLIYEGPGIGIPLDLDLTGFSAGMKALENAQK